MEERKQVNRLKLIIASIFIIILCIFYLFVWSNPIQKDTTKHELRRDTLTYEQAQKILKEQIKQQNAKMDSLLKNKKNGKEQK